MKYTTLGRTDLRVSRLCLGCMSYGAPKWRAWVLDESAAQPFFKKAVEAGINFFDTANMYSLGVSEEVTGRALKQFARRDEIVIATKVFFPWGDGADMKGLSRTAVLKACDASLKRLGIDTIDLYQIHRFDPDIPLDETLGALNDLVKAGKVRYIGASSGFASQMEEALAISRKRGWAEFVSMQNHYNLIYREEEREMIPLCRREKLGVIPWSPQARGLLARPRPKTGFGDTARADGDIYTKTLYNTASDWDVVDATERVAKARGASMSEVALAWLLRQPAVTAPIVGATKLHHLEMALKAVDLALSDEECRALEASYQPHDVKGIEFVPAPIKRL